MPQPGGGAPGGGTYVLVGDGLLGLAHELLDVLEAAHLGVDGLEDAVALLQAETQEAIAYKTR